MIHYRGDVKATIFLRLPYLTKKGGGGVWLTPEISLGSSSLPGCRAEYGDDTVTKQELTMKRLKEGGGRGLYKK